MLFGFLVMMWVYLDGYWWLVMVIVVVVGFFFYLFFGLLFLFVYVVQFIGSKCSVIFGVVVYVMSFVVVVLLVFLFNYVFYGIFLIKLVVWCEVILFLQGGLLIGNVE